MSQDTKPARPSRAEADIHTAGKSRVLDRAFRGTRHPERQLFGPDENERLFHCWAAFLARLGIGEEGEWAGRTMRGRNRRFQAARR
jgi:hypothetical protein